MKNPKKKTPKKISDAEIENAINDILEQLQKDCKPVRFWLSNQSADEPATPARINVEGTLTVHVFVHPEKPADPPPQPPLLRFEDDGEV